MKLYRIFLCIAVLFVSGLASAYPMVAYYRNMAHQQDASWGTSCIIENFPGGQIHVGNTIYRSNGSTHRGYGYGRSDDAGLNALVDKVKTSQFTTTPNTTASYDEYFSVFIYDAAGNKTEIPIKGSGRTPVNNDSPHAEELSQLIKALCSPY